MNVLVFMISFYFWNVTSSSKNVTVKRNLVDDYYLNYDYEITNSSINNIDVRKVDSLLVPNPENVESKYSIDVLEHVELPDDSLADTDLRDHDFIDNLMYVYYGSHNRNGNSYGPEIIIIGSGISCAAQLLTIFCVLLKKHLNNGNKRDTKNLFLHMLGSYCFSNLLFMLGVHATKNSVKCLCIALILHYSHLLTAFWMFLYCYHMYERFSTKKSLQFNYLLSVGYGTPFVFAMISYLIAPNSFETRRFCFMSVEKGMIFNYMLPVSFLIVTTTVYSLIGIKKINSELSKLEFSSSAESLNALKNELNDGKERKADEEVISLRESKTCLKLLCLVQSGYDVVWFIVVLALENNNDNNSMAIIYSVTSCLLNWYIFAKSKAFLPSVANVMVSIENITVQLDPEKVNNVVKDDGFASVTSSSDNIPLLVNNENGTELRELRLDYISTISN